VLSRMIHERTLEALERGLDAAALRHRLLANNIANANTPGYKRRDIAFQESLRSAVTMLGGSGGGGVMRLKLERSHPAHASGGPTAPPRLGIVADRTAGRNDGNNVDVEHEMVLLAENSLWYEAMVRQLQHKLGRIRSAVTGGRR